MKSLTFEVTEAVKAWYQSEITVTEDDVRKYILGELEKLSPESSGLREIYENWLEEFVDDPDHEAWREVVWEKFGAERDDKKNKIETETCDSDAELLERDGWDDDEES